MMEFFRDPNEIEPIKKNRKGKQNKAFIGKKFSAIQRTVCEVETIVLDEDTCENPVLDVCGRNQEVDALDSTKELESLLPFDDTGAPEDGNCETQWMDYEDETQVLYDFDVNGETQLVNDHCLAGETQLVDDPNIGDKTQLLEDAYLGGGTQMMDDPDYEFATQFLNDPCYGGETQVVDDQELGGETQVEDDQELGGETQVVDDHELGGETQVFDDHELGGETQVVDDHDLGGETQVLNDDDDFENLCTQVVIDSEGEETDNTEVLSDTEEFCDSDSMKIIGSHSMHKDNLQCSSPLKQHGNGLAENTDNLTDNSDSLTKPACETDDLCDRRDFPHIGEESGHDKHLWSNEHMREAGDKIVSSTMRKLFHEDLPSENKNPTNNDVANDYELAGLSYIDSQEPGDLSQAKALDFVDNFLKVNVVETGEQDEHRGICASNLKPTSVAKGSLSVAKIANLKTTYGKSGIYDWDDVCEDEGGGDFFCRKKEELFNTKGHDKRSFTMPRSFKGCKSNQLKVNDEQSNFLDKTTNVAYSDPKLLQRGSKGKGRTVEAAELNVKKNLICEFNEQLNVNPLGDSSTVLVGNTNRIQMENVGLDTQLAAEAMEELCQMEFLGNEDVNIPYQDNQNTTEGLQSKKRSNRSKAVTRQIKKPKITDTKSSKESSISTKIDSNKRGEQFGVGQVKAKAKRTKSNVKEQLATKRNQSTVRLRSNSNEQRQKGALEKTSVNEVRRHNNDATLIRRVSVKTRSMLEKTGTFTPIAKRTRQSITPTQLNKGGNTTNDSTEPTNSREKRNKRAKCNVDSNLSNTKKESLKKRNSPYTDNAFIGGLSYPTRKRTRQSFCRQLNESGNLDATSKLVDRQDLDGNDSTRLKGSEVDAQSNSFDLCTKRAPSSSAYACPVKSGNLVHQISDKEGSGSAAHQFDYDNVKGKKFHEDVINGKESNHSERMMDATEVSPRDKCEQSGSACLTPFNGKTQRNATSPVCMGNEYFKQSCKNSRSRSCLMEQFNSTISTVPDSPSPSKESRKRRDIAHVRALFSHHLNDDTIKQQKKILARLGASVASSISDATHFITDTFVRTRNMLEAIARGKPVVTHLWLESCDQTSCFIDEKSYILRDEKKEKEFGFCMPVSLARSCQHPLLLNRRVFVTPNTNPGKDIIASLVKAVHGQAVERICRSALKDDKIPDDLLVLSCDEDYSICVPFLEKGASVYSSELLLNGIVTQKLDYERFVTQLHAIFR